MPCSPVLYTDTDTELVCPRFPGCKCKSKCTTNACSCAKAQRECDPDLCSSCLDGRLEWDPANNTCRNVMIQRELGKKLIVAPSDIAGWGCFIGEKTDKNEFIAEYVGELISQDESERRGKIYDKAKCSYMFQINEKFCVDAARYGNVLTIFLFSIGFSSFIQDGRQDPFRQPLFQAQLFGENPEG